MAADQEPLAARLHARYGAAVTLTLGHFPYPVGRPVTSADRVSRGSPPPPQVVTVDGLDARLELSSDHIVAGRNGHGTVVLTNTGAVALELRTGQPLVAVVLAPETGEVVGGYTGAVAGVGLNVHLAPGGQASVQVLFGTASFRADLGFVLPAGRYLVRAEVPVHSHPPRHGGARQVLAVPPCRLTVAPVVPPELRNQLLSNCRCVGLGAARFCWVCTTLPGRTAPRGVVTHFVSLLKSYGCVIPLRSSLCRFLDQDSQRPRTRRQPMACRAIGERSNFGCRYLPR